MQSRIFNYIYTQPTKNILYNPKLQNHINHCERVNVKYTTQENYKLNFRKEYFKIRPLFFSSSEANNRKLCADWEIGR